MARNSKKQAVRNKDRIQGGYDLVRVKELKYGDYVISQGTVVDVGIKNEHMFITEQGEQLNAPAWYFTAHLPHNNEFQTHYFSEGSEVKVFRYVDLPEKKPLQHAKGAGTISSRTLKEQSKISNHHELVKN